MRPHQKCSSSAAGFSLLELSIAMTVTLVILSLASALVANAFGIRTRENTKSDAVADTIYALNIMSREIANAGASLPQNQGLPANGIVAADSNNQAIRVVSNPNQNTTVRDADEDVLYRFYVDNSTVPSQRYIVRYSVNAVTNQTTVLANRIDNMMIRYYPQKVDYTSVAGTCDISNVTAKTLDAAGNVVSTPVNEVVDLTQARYLVLVICVTLPAVGMPNSPDYQPPSQVQLTSDVSLRNSTLYYY